jgi:hypothetical protein
MTGYVSGRARANNIFPVSFFTQRAACFSWAQDPESMILQQDLNLPGTHV